MTRDEWLAVFAEELGVAPPTTEEVDRLLELAATAAHASERTAAPVACWLTARAGRSPAEGAALAERVDPG